MHVVEDLMTVAVKDITIRNCSTGDSCKIGMKHKFTQYTIQKLLTSAHENQEFRRSLVRSVSLNYIIFTILNYFHLILDFNL